jgi:hypothetical protein
MTVPSTICPRCLVPVMSLRTPTGDRIMVDPIPRPGGMLIVNGVAGRVIGQVPSRGPGSLEDTSWWPHVAVCPRVLGRRRTRREAMAA